MSNQTTIEAHANGFLCEAEPWFEWLRSKGRSEVTLREYRYRVGKFAQFAAKESVVSFRHLQQDHVESWLRSMFRAKLSGITIDSYLTPVAHLCNWLEARGQIFLNPCRDIVRPIPQRRLHSVSSEEDMCRLLDSVGGGTPIELRDRAIMEVAYASGFRCRELTSLDLASIDLDGATVQAIGKGNAERKGLLTRAAVSAVQKYLSGGRTALLGEKSEHGALWLDTEGRRLAAPQLTITVTKRAASIGLHVTPHGIRRAFATHLLRRGASPFELRRLLGHISYQNLRHYLRYAPEELLAMHRASCLGQ